MPTRKCKYWDSHNPGQEWEQSSASGLPRERLPSGNLPSEELRENLVADIQNIEAVYRPRIKPGCTHDPNHWCCAEILALATFVQWKPEDVSMREWVSRFACSITQTDDGEALRPCATCSSIFSGSTTVFMVTPEKLDDLFPPETQVPDHTSNQQFPQM